MFQSTFPQGERRGSFEVAKKLNAVSIHVPARGTTTSDSINDLSWFVSIHVPARGTTGSHRNVRYMFHVFQSTFPQGERRFFVIINC